MTASDQQQALLSPERPTASVSLDLDNQWSYMKTHGEAGWEQFPSYLAIAVPRILAFLRERKLTITFFIVGQDAALASNQEVLRSIADAGHEIGNHSFAHEPWLHLYTQDELRKDLREAHDHIRRATGRAPVGFRGPGFSLSTDTLRTLLELGYEYDATVFPNALNPLARAYFFAGSNLSREERKRRGALFGTFRDALRPVKPFRWKIDTTQLTEIPVTTMPFFRLPIHLSYILYASRFSRGLAMLYYRIGLGLCRLTGTAPSLLLHPLDFLGAQDCAALHFFPGMDMAADAKIAIVSKALALLEENYEVGTVARHAREVSGAPAIRSLEPDFRSGA